MFNVAFYKSYRDLQAAEPLKSVLIPGFERGTSNAAQLSTCACMWFVGK